MKTANALKVINNKKEFPITNRVVWDYFYHYQKKHIDSVGMVTKNFWPFQAIMYDIKMYMDVLTWEESASKTAWLKELSMSLDVEFKWLKKELLVGAEYTAAKTHQHVFKATNFEHQESGAPMVSAICVRAGRKAISRARKMFFQPLTRIEMAKSHVIEAEEKLTLNNALAFCQIMEDVGRMSQEGTIDSTKSGNAPKILQYSVKTECKNGSIVDVTLMQALSRITLKSRKNDSFGVKLNFDASEVEVKHNDRLSAIDGKGRYVIADMLDKIRINGLDNAIHKDAAEQIFAAKQELPEEQVAICSRLAQQSANADAIRVLMNIYRNLRNTQKADIHQAAEDAGKNDEAKKAGIAVAKEQTKVAYKALSNVVRSLLRVTHMSNEQMIQLILGITFKYMGKDAKRPSSFAGIILSEEFFEYIMSLYPENPELCLTRDDLAACDAEDGEQVEFVGGVVPGRAIFSQERNAIPDGVYTVRKDGKHAWIEADVRERIESRIAEAYSPKELIFQTEPIHTEEEADALLNTINGAKEVVLVDEMHNPNTGKSMYSTVLADGKAVASIHVKIKNMVKDEKRELVVNKINGKDDYKIAQSLRKFYADKTGEVTFAHKLSFGEDGKKQYAVIVVLKDTKKIGYCTMSKIKANAVVPEGFCAKKKTVNVSSFDARRAHFRAMMGSDEVKEKKKVTQLTLMQRLMAKRIAN